MSPSLPGSNKPDNPIVQPRLVRSSIRVLVCDDDAMVRRALRAYLATVPDINVVAEAASVRTAQLLLAGRRVTDPDATDKKTEDVPGSCEHGVDVVLLDLRMPGHREDGHALAVWAATLPQPPRILYLTSYPDDEVSHEAAAGLVAGVLHKDIEPQALAQAIRTAHAGLAVLTPDTMAPLRNQHTRANSNRPTPDLSARDFQVLAGVCGGLSNAQIAARIYVSESTVKSDIASLLGRFGVSNRVTLALAAVDAGVLDSTH